MEPPNYDDLDPPPSYAALFPNQKVNSIDSANDTLVIDVEQIDTVVSEEHNNRSTVLGIVTLASGTVTTASTAPTAALLLTSTASTNNN